MGAVVVAVMLTVAAPWPRATADPASAAPIMLGGAILLAILACVNSMTPDRGRWPAGLGWFALFVVWSILGTERGPSPYHAELMLAVWMSGLAVFAALAFATESPTQIRACHRTLFYACGAIATYGLVLEFQGSVADRLSATFSNADCFAALLVLGLGLGLGLLGNASKETTLLATATVFVIVAALMLTESRAGAVGAAAAIVFYAACVVGLRLGTRHLLRTLLPIVCTIAVVMALGGMAHVGERLSKLWTEQDQQGMAVRAMVLQGTIPTLMQAPLTGCGPGNFALAFTASRPHGSFRGYINQAHADPIQILVEAGVVGIVLFIGAVFLSLRSSLQSARRVGTGALGVAAAIVGVMVYGLANFAVPVPADFLWICATLGLGCAYGRFASSHHEGVAVAETDRPAAGRWPRLAARAPSFAVSALAVGMAVFVGIVGWRTFFGGRLATQAETLATDLRWEGALHALDRALQYEPRNEKLYALRAQLEIRLACYSNNSGLFSKAVQDMQRALNLNRGAKGLSVEASRLFVSAGDKNAAERTLKAARDACPTDIGPRTELGLLYMDEHRFHEAAQCFFEVVPDLPETENTLASALEEAENAGEGGVSILKAELGKLDPGLLRKVALAAAQRAEKDAHPSAAEAFYNELVAWDSHDPCAALGLARVSSVQGHVHEAMDTLEKALTSAPTKAQPGTADTACYDEASMMLADLRLTSHEYEGAIKFLTDYLESTPESVAARLKLAEAYVAVGHVELAIATLQDALARDPDNREVHERLARLYEKSEVQERRLPDTKSSL